MSLSVGVPKAWKPGDYKGLLDMGLTVEIKFMDSGFPSSTDEARLFELFGASVRLLGCKETHERASQWKQHIAALECPTTGIFRFKILREGGFFSK